MKYTTLICLLFFTIITSNAQNVLIAKYNFLHVIDTTQPENYTTEEMLLITNTNKSIYKSFTLDAYLNEQSDLNANNNSKRVVKIPKVTTEQLFLNHNTKEIVTIKPLMEDTFGIKSPLQSINWQLIDSTKQIGNLNCKKAIGEFKGRIYTCWYSPEIAVRSGPWKLHGLPGLIIQANDEKNQVSFSLISLKQTNDKDILLPKNLTYVTEARYAEIKESFLSNASGFFGGVTNTKEKNIQVQSKSNKSSSKKKFNNPLELY